ncbi:MAG: cytochrome c biogenesis protein CcdA [Muribaculaceae bacterium]
MVDPIQWSHSIEKSSDTEGKLLFSATMEKGWHFYGMQLPDGGPNPTEFVFDQKEGIEFGEPTPSVKATVAMDEVFGLELSWWESDVTFTVSYKVIDETKVNKISGYVSFQGCNDEMCIAPTKVSFSYKINDNVVEDDTEEIATEEGENSAEADIWAPVEIPEGDANSEVSSQPWWYIFLLGFGGGFIALLTPCVWPLIPMTVSFFLKKNSDKSKSIREAMIYGASIIVIYLLLGLTITAVFGASKLNDLATNAVFNLAFFLLLLVFAISFFGAFDIKLPSKWSTSIDNRAESTTGILSIFFMAFTLALVSFSCTGPIIGTLLVEAASSGDIVGPAVGMAGFAIALALPFTLFAIFPSWLKEMPKSGGWLNSVKVVLGFLELALALKFLSVADLAYGWGILDREVFICLWVVIFAMLGFYLLGKIRFSHDSPVESVSILRFFLSLISLSFAIYLIPGLWGAPLKSVSAFVPPLYTQDFNLYEDNNFKQFDDYDQGMAYAEENGLPVLIDFSGYGCVNCRKMEGAVFDTPEVKKIISENFVLITLMVDDKKELSKPIDVEENGKEVRLYTVGDKWSYLQRHKFAANSQPYYIILDNEGKALSIPFYYEENLPKFTDWLNKGIDSYINN